MPERITPMLCSCWSCARERRKKSIGRRSPRGAAGFEQVQDPVQDGHVLVRRDHIDAVRLHRVRSLTWITFMPVARWSSSGMMPLRVGSRCWTMTNAMPLPAGTCPGTVQGLESPGGGADADDGERRTLRT
jgi:hypothetical protein